jgi:poly(hydroxyalkanoate) depolymerase family esterase
MPMYPGSACAGYPLIDEKETMKTNRKMLKTMHETGRLIFSGSSRSAASMFQRMFPRNRSTDPDQRSKTGAAIAAPQNSVAGKRGSRRRPNIVLECASDSAPGSTGSQMQPDLVVKSQGIRRFKSAKVEANTGAQFLTRSYTNQAGTREYKLFIPSGYSGQALPLIVMLHGCKQDPDDFAAGTRMNDLAEEQQCLVAYPAQTSSANGFRCWNWFNSVDQQRGQGEPSIIAGITAEIIENYHADKQRIYVAGLSSGGSMAVIMGTTYPDLYAAVGVHSGLAYAGANNLYSAILAMRRGARLAPYDADHTGATDACPRAISTIVFHGDEDKTVHPDNGDQVMAHSAPNSIGGTPPTEMEMSVKRGQVPNGHDYTQTIYFDHARKVVAEHWLVHGAAHAWSGGNPAGSFTDPKGPDATREMLRFFFSQSQSSS